MSFSGDVCTKLSKVKITVKNVRRTGRNRRGGRRRPQSQFLRSLQTTEKGEEKLRLQEGARDARRSHLLPPDRADFARRKKLRVCANDVRVQVPATEFAGKVARVQG